jgi:hypothetical protein
MYQKEHIFFAVGVDLSWFATAAASFVLPILV